MRFLFEYALRLVIRGYLSDWHRIERQSVLFPPRSVGGEDLHLYLFLIRYLVDALTAFFEAPVAFSPDNSHRIGVNIV
ncbi:hypothetical protein [Halomicrobium salinisoli]|uniref:hypothetical protein n=1 Tax=Halomicrobium salinisoli TaxID=2878391 RepID=UPI001CF03C4C|nr:hypothetical protein [Halomicrobium salinisoli]